MYVLLANFGREVFQAVLACVLRLSEQGSEVPPEVPPELRAASEISQVHPQYSSMYPA